MPTGWPIYAQPSPEGIVFVYSKPRKYGLSMRLIIASRRTAALAAELGVDDNQGGRGPMDEVPDAPG